MRAAPRLSSASAIEPRGAVRPSRALNGILAFAVYGPISIGYASANEMPSGIAQAWLDRGERWSRQFRRAFARVSSKGKR